MCIRDSSKTTISATKPVGPSRRPLGAVSSSRSEAPKNTDVAAPGPTRPWDDVVESMGIDVVAPAVRAHLGSGHVVRRRETVWCVGWAWVLFGGAEQPCSSHLASKRAAAARESDTRGDGDGSMSRRDRHIFSTSSPLEAGHSV